MEKINPSEVAAIITAAIEDFFDSMLSMDVAVSSLDARQTLNGRSFQATIDIEGQLAADMQVAVEHDFARLMAASMLDTSPEEIENEADIGDVVGELCSIISGNLKTGLGKIGVTCEFSPPALETIEEPEDGSQGLNTLATVVFQKSSHNGYVQITLPAEAQVDGMQVEGVVDGQTETPDNPPDPGKDPDPDPDPDTDTDLDPVPDPDPDQSPNPSALPEDDDDIQFFDDFITADDEVLTPVPETAAPVAQVPEVADSDGIEVISPLPPVDEPSDSVEVGISAEIPSDTSDSRSVVDDPPSSSPTTTQARDDDGTIDAQIQVDEPADNTFVGLDDTDDEPEDMLAHVSPPSGVDPPPTESKRRGDASSGDRSAVPDPLPATGDSTDATLHSANEAPTSASKSQTPSVSTTKPKKRRVWFWVTAILLAFLAGLGAYVYYDRFGSRQIQPTAVPGVLETQMPAASVAPVPMVELENATPPSPTAALEESLVRAGLRRSELIQKQSEVAELKRYFVSGIKQLEAEIVYEINRRQIESFENAIKNKRVELALQTIQRRQKYLLQLERPSQWLLQGSEELLYLERKTRLYMRLLPFAAGVDPDRLLIGVQTAIETYGTDARHLSLPEEEPHMDTLETIWRRIDALRSSSPAAVTAEVGIRKIWEEICAGDHRHRSELTQLDTATAQCLARDGGTDMILNAIEDLPPPTLEHLTRWEGHWLCLNGLTELPPESATHLAAWNGNSLSLNGLKHLPPESARLLSQWRGRQLELVGLAYSGAAWEDRTLAYLGQWRRSGGRLFVSPQVDRRVNAIGGSTQHPTGGVDP